MTDWFLSDTFIDQSFSISSLSYYYPSGECKRREKKEQKGWKQAANDQGMIRPKGKTLFFKIVFEEIRDKNKYRSVRAPWDDKSYRSSIIEHGLVVKPSISIRKRSRSVQDLDWSGISVGLRSRWVHDHGRSIIYDHSPRLGPHEGSHIIIWLLV